VVHIWVKVDRSLLLKSARYMPSTDPTNLCWDFDIQVLNEIATLYFAIPPPRTQAVNPFGDMFSSLFGGAASGQQPRRLQPAGAASNPGLDWEWSWAHTH
jgi:hypothetical protein